MESARNSVHELAINETGFALLAKAIEVKSLQTKRFETLKSVVTSALDQELTSGMPKLEFFQQHLPMSGEIRVFLRIDQRTNAKIEAVKSQMAEILSDPCSVREAVLYCAFATANFAD